MNPDTHDRLSIAASQHREQMIDMTMHIAIGKKSQEMQCRAPLSNTLRHFQPGTRLLTLEDRTVRNRPGDELGPLIEDPSRADRVMPDLAIAHVVITRHPHGPTVCDQLSRRHRFGKPVERGCTREPDRIRIVSTTTADTIHHTDDDRSGNPGELRILLECPFSHSSLVFPCLVWSGLTASYALAAGIRSQ